MKKADKELAIQMLKRLSDDLKRKVHTRSCKHWTRCPAQCICRKTRKKPLVLGLHTAMAWSMGNNIGTIADGHGDTIYIPELKEDLKKWATETSVFIRVLGFHDRQYGGWHNCFRRTRQLLRELQSFVETGDHYYKLDFQRKLTLKKSII